MQAYTVEVALSIQEDGLWRAEVPALPGCFVDEDRIEEAMACIQEVIRLFIESYRERNEPLPPELKVVPPGGTVNLILAVNA